MRKSFDAEFLAKVTLDAIREEKTLAKLLSQYEVHKTQIAKWCKRAIEGLGGQLNVENEWLKKSQQIECR